LPRAHPPRPALLVPVAHGERERRPERDAVPEPREHLDLVLLDALARAAAVPLAAAAQVLVDRLAVEAKPGRKTGENRDERGPVRLARSDELERHAGKPSAARMTSTGASRPVQGPNEAAPCPPIPPGP